MKAFLGYHVISLLPFVVSTALLWAVEVGSGVPLPVAALLLGLFALRQLNVLVVTVLYHRAYAHRSVELHPTFGVLLRLWGWLFTGLGVRTWALVHRWHHALGDGPDAPFSPSRPGGSLWGIGRETVRAHLGAIRDPAALARYGPDLPDDALERFVHADERRFFGVLGVRMAVTVAACTALMAALGLTGGWALAGAAACLPGLAGGVTVGTVFAINGLGHLVGYRSFDTRDTSHNVVAFDWLGMGEGLHNNHHAFPGSARFARGPGELDLGWVVLRGLQRLGWVTATRS